VKAQRIAIKQRNPHDLLQEYLDLGYDAEIDGDEIVVYYGKQQGKKKAHKQQQSEKWSKRERNFGYTRG